MSKYEECLNDVFTETFKHPIRFETGITQVRYPVKHNGESLSFSQTRFVAGFKAGWDAAKADAC